MKAEIKTEVASISSTSEAETPKSQVPKDVVSKSDDNRSKDSGRGTGFNWKEPEGR